MTEMDQLTRLWVLNAAEIWSLSVRSKAANLEMSEMAGKCWRNSLGLRRRSGQSHNPLGTSKEAGPILVER